MNASAHHISPNSMFRIISRKRASAKLSSAFSTARYRMVGKMEIMKETMPAEDFGYCFDCLDIQALGVISMMSEKFR